MTRLVVVSDALFAADGIARVSLDVCRSMAEAGDEVTLVYPERDYERPRLIEWMGVASDTIAVPEISMGRRKLASVIRALPSTIRAVRQDRQDVFYVHRPAHVPFARAIDPLGRMPIVLHLHAFPGDSPRLDRVRASPVARFIAVSQAVADAWIEVGVGSEKMTVVLNGVDTEAWAPTDADVVLAARRRLGVAEDARVVGFVGRFAPVKGIDTLVRAFRRLAARVPGVHLVLVGALGDDDPVVSQVRRDLAGLDHTISPAVDDPRELMGTFDVGVVPSLSDSFPLVAIELLACGVPVVGSRTGGIPEVLGPGLAPRLTEVGDAMALAASIEAVLAEPPDALRAEARRRGEALDRSAMVGGVAEVLRETARTS